MQTEEVLSTDVSYETRIEGKLDISSSEYQLNICCSCNKYGLCMVVKESRILVLKIEDMEGSCSASSPTDALLKQAHQVEFDESVLGVYLSPLEEHLCIALESAVIVVRIEELVLENNHRDMDVTEMMTRQSNDRILCAWNLTGDCTPGSADSNGSVGDNTQLLQLLLHSAASQTLSIYDDNFGLLKATPNRAADAISCYNGHVILCVDSGFTVARVTGEGDVMDLFASEDVCDGETGRKYRDVNHRYEL